MKRYCFLLVTILFLLVAAQACSKSNTSIGGGETNWLKKCDSDSDCSEGISCECGICTKSCESSDDCTDVRGASSCLVTESLDDGRCRVAAAGESEQGICVARCETDGDCNNDSDFNCISGICTAIIDEEPSDAEDDETTYGLVFPNSDAGGSFPLGLTETADANVLATDSSVEQDGPGVLSGDATTGQDPGILSEDAAMGQEVALGPVLQSATPRCPCTADIEQGSRAPTMEAYPDNAYGGPEWDSRLPTQYRNCMGGWREIPESTNLGLLDLGIEGYESTYQGLLDLCFYFVVCTPDCEADDDCPRETSGSAIPRCSSTSGCYLDCGSQRTCPDGMTCVQGVDGASCLWAQDKPTPGCPAYCEGDWLPRECSNYCASLLTACNPEKGVSCCDGLVCTSEGYCVQE